MQYFVYCLPYEFISTITITLTIDGFFFFFGRKTEPQQPYRGVSEWVGAYGMLRVFVIAWRREQTNFCDCIDGQVHPYTHNRTTSIHFLVQYFLYKIYFVIFYISSGYNNFLIWTHMLIISTPNFQISINVTLKFVFYRSKFTIQKSFTIKQMINQLVFP